MDARAAAQGLSRTMLAATGLPVVVAATCAAPRKRMNMYRLYRAQGAGNGRSCQNLRDFALALILLAASLPPAKADTCESLAALALPYTTIIAAQSIPAGTFTPPGSGPIAGLPAFCRVAGVVAPTSDSNITFEVWMPSSGWNGKYQQIGNGGFGGYFFYASINGQPGMAEALRRGYATAATDDGHAYASNSIFNIFDATWALGHPERVIDFGYRAMHETAEKSKAVIEALYGTTPSHAYFNGCSSGGREALMEAQRYPEDFDGIIAGAPAIGMTHLEAGFLWNQQSLLGDTAGYVPFAKLPAITSAALAACDALDGISDGLINDPLRCHFDPSVLTCTGAESNACLTTGQLASVQRIYAGPRNPRTGKQIFPGYMPGAEAFNLGRGSWTAWVTGTAPGNANEFVSANQFFTYMTFEDPVWDFRTFNFDSDVAFTDTKLASILNATSPDLSAFRARGGKLLSFHGWNDPAIAPLNSVNYYESVIRAVANHPGNAFGDIVQGHAMRETQRFFRLFMAPGVAHCMGGGPGPNTFDVLTALENWVEHGVAPDRIIASHSTGGIVDRTRPLCPYPQVVTYTGTGTTDDAANFVCVTADLDDDEEKPRPSND